jgi:hypothetical protein
MRNLDTVVFDNFCSEKNCEHYREWRLWNDLSAEGTDCFSCQLVGKSFNIIKYPINCPFSKEIEEYKKKETMRNFLENKVKI